MSLRTMKWKLARERRDHIIGEVILRVVQGLIVVAMLVGTWLLVSMAIIAGS